MGKLAIILMFYSMAIAGTSGTNSNPTEVIAMPAGSNPGADPDPDPVEEWFQNLNLAKPKTIKIRFYVQDDVSGDNQTVWEVAQSTITAASPSFFGRIYMADNLLTAGPEPDSKIVGRAQGTIGFADLHEIAIHMVVNIIFTEGEYNGSTISILGRNPLGQTERELPIVGGSGVFRMARGIAVTKTWSSFDQSKSCEVLEYSLYVIYY